MKMKKAIAGLVASVVAISAMATTMVSAEETKVFETYTVKHTASATVTVKGKLATAAAVTIDVSDLFGAAVAVDGDSIAITSATCDGDIADLLSINKDTQTVTVPAIAFTADKAYTIKIKAATKGLANKNASTAAKDAAKADGSTVTVSGDAAAIKGVGDQKAVTAKDYTKFVKDGEKAAIVIGSENYHIVSLDYFGGNGLVASLANYLSSNSGAKVTFKFVVPTKDADDDIKAPDYTQAVDFGGVTANDFGIIVNETSKLSTSGTVDKTAGTITFDWDTVLKASNISNATGLVNNIEVQAKAALAGYAIESITVTLGAAVTDPEASTPDASTPDSSTPGTSVPNPTTGNAPIALAVIPVALAAAAVVASKKRA